MTRDEVVEALTVERYGSQWAARERQRQDERRRLLHSGDTDAASARDPTTGHRQNDPDSNDGGK